MHAFIEDPFWNEQETINFYEYTVFGKATLFSSLFFFYNISCFSECKHSKADNVTPFNFFLLKIKA